MRANFQSKWTNFIFLPKFGEIAQLRPIFWFSFFEGVAESWVKVEMSWVEVGGAGGRWMELGGAEWRRMELGGGGCSV